MEGDNFMFVVSIRDMFTYTGLTEVEITVVTVTLYNVVLTKITSDDVLDSGPALIHLVA